MNNVWKSILLFVVGLVTVATILAITNPSTINTYSYEINCSETITSHDEQTTFRFARHRLYISAPELPQEEVWVAQKEEGMYALLPFCLKTIKVSKTPEYIYIQHTPDCIYAYRR